MSTYFDSRDPACKSPFGAVPCGTEVSFAVFCTDEENIVSGALHVTEEFAGREQTVPLTLSGGAWRCVYAAPRRPELAWYRFSLRRRSGETVTLAQRQLTVYEEYGAAPDWFGRGVSYQIFPDRFCRSRVPDPAGLVGDRTVHENWQDTPEFRPDERGEIRNRDFFGGDLAGIISKLDYLKSLGVTTLYLNPIFEAASNHRYNTADYMAIDPMLGTAEDFRALCREAHARGMRVLLDGVFNHTGDDSLYFNRYGRYDSVGAYQSPDSPYAGWFTFERFPDKYKCWWGVDTLPEVNKDNEDYRRFILAEDGVARRWMRAGTAGWRLDVADELPMRFLRDLRTAVRTQDAQAALLGEVWEDASNKVSYGAQRCYCLGDTLDSVMNYPLRKAAIGFVTGTLDAYAFCRMVESLRENYPLPFFYSLMNLMGSHDRARLLNVLAGETWEQVDPLERGGCRLSDAQRALAIRRLAEMWKLYAALPGMPSVYYGDEAGMEGAADPFCRFPYPWGREDAQVMTITREALALRASRPILRRGALQLHPIDRDTVRIRRFAYAGCDVFGEPLDDAEFEINVHAIHA